MTDMLNPPARIPRRSPPLTREPDFKTSLCASIGGQELPQSPPKPLLSELPRKPLFSESH